MFENVIGYDYVKEELATIIGWYRDEKILNDKKYKLPKGIVFYGQPGNGKTLFVRELINAFNTNAYIVQGDEDKIESEITKIYEEARKNPFSLVLIDELDLLIDKNSSVTRVLQDELDGINQDGGRVLTIATTNYYDSLPEALRRSGRFDRQIEIDTPDKETRIKLLEHCFNIFKIDSSCISIKYLAEMTHYYSCAEIIAICNDLSLRYGNKIITNKDFLKSRDICNGRIRYNMKSSKVQDRMIAIHEVGHALIALKYSNNYRVLMTNYSRGGGYTQTCPTDGAAQSIESEIQDIEISLAGTICEKLFNGFQSTGADDDLENARGKANYVVNRYGIYGISSVLKRYDTYARMETEKTRLINERLANRLLKECEKRVTKYLKNKGKLVYCLADLMQQNGFLLEEDIQKTINEFSINCKMKIAS